MTDFRDWLASELEQRKERNPNYSLRAFARQLDVSPAQLSQLLSAKRDVTIKLARKIIESVGPPPSESKRLLRSLGGSKMSFLETSQKRKIEEDEFKLISDWYHFAILSLTRVKGAKSDPRWIASRLGISVTEARQATDRLVRLGLVKTKPKFEQVGDPLEVVSEVSSAAIQSFHRQIMGLASEKIESTTVEKKEFQSMTLALDTKKIPLAKKLISDAIDEITTALEGPPSKEVYSLSIQFFPLTKGDHQND